MSGAIDFNECPYLQRAKLRARSGTCRCERCAVCGHHKHTGIHGPRYGEPPGSEPWGHEFQPKERSEPDG